MKKEIFAANSGYYSGYKDNLVLFSTRAAADAYIAKFGNEYGSIEVYELDPPSVVNLLGLVRDIRCGGE